MAAILRARVRRAIVGFIPPGYQTGVELLKRSSDGSNTGRVAHP